MGTGALIGGALPRHDELLQGVLGTYQPAEEERVSGTIENETGTFQTVCLISGPVSTSRPMKS
jgi:hypothetical protein